MQYILLIYGDESSGAHMSAEEQGKTMQEWTDYTQWLKDTGWYLAGDALHPTSAATTVRHQAEGATLTTDGPFAETKEQLGGYYLLECKDLDQAIEASSKMPIRGGGVEIRPVMLFDDEGRPRR
ncbi:MAG: YciI family protein [Actinobacteria bacterium]|nr:YciI family protein [Actinomycetota bacterium]